MTDVGKMRREMKRRAVGRRAELVAGDGAPNDDGDEVVVGMVVRWRSEGGGVVVLASGRAMRPEGVVGPGWQAQWSDVTACPLRAIVPDERRQNVTDGME